MNDRPAQARSTLAPVIALVVCCILWGYSFPVMQIATGAFEKHIGASGLAARAWFNGIRFGLAALLYWLISHRQQKGMSRDAWIGGGIVGAFFAGGMLLQVMGLVWALPSVSGFLTALAVVFAPLGQAMLFKRHVSGGTWFAVLLAVLGMILLSWPKPDAHAANTLAITPPIPYLGEILTVLASMLFSAEILAVDHYGQKVTPARLTFIMLATTSLLSLITGAALSGGAPIHWRGLMTDATLRWSMASLILFSSVAALHLMMVHQPRLSPATASVIYCTEPLFATMFSLIFATERLTLLTVSGGMVVVIAVYVVARRAGKNGTEALPVQ